MIKRNPLIIIISAPSGSGKTTIVERLLEKMPDVTRAVSFTTRNPRKGEVNKEDYIFVSQKEFAEKIKKNEFLEWEKKFGFYYGTCALQLKEAVENGKNILLSIDVKGAETIKKIFPKSISIFIMPPSVEELETRLRKRKTDHEAQVVLRLKESESEIKASKGYDHIIINEDVQKAAEEIRNIIETKKKDKK